MIRNGDVMVDGSSVGDVKEAAIEERTKMADGGIVVIGVTVSSKKRQILSEPDIQMRGFIYMKNNEPLLNSIATMLNTALTNLLVNSEKKISIPEMSKKISDKISRFIVKNTDKEPMVFLEILDIDQLEKVDPR